MSTTAPRVIQPGDPAPDFTLPAVQRDGTVSLADYRGRSPLLLAFFRGIYCPFCRRQVAKLGLAQEKLRAAGVETLAVVASPLERTRLYFQYRPTRVPLAVDPDLASHRAFGITKFPLTPEVVQAHRGGARPTRWASCRARCRSTRRWPLFTRRTASS